MIDYGNLRLELHFYLFSLFIKNKSKPIPRSTIVKFLQSRMDTNKIDGFLLQMEEEGILKTSIEPLPIRE